MQLISGVWSSRSTITLPPPGADDEMSFLNTITALLPADQAKSHVVLGYHSKGDGGGGTFYWDAGGLKTSHNGGTVIDPGRTFPIDWTNETQKTTWYTAAGSGSGVWLRADTNEAIDGRCFGVKLDSPSPVTDNTKALQKAIDIVSTIYLPGGKYKTSTLQMRDKMKLLALSGKIHLVTTDRMILRASGTGDFTGMEFHGILESTSTDITLATDQRGLLLFYFVNGIIDDINFEGVEYICPNCQANGVLFAVSFDAYPARTWVKSGNFRNSKFSAMGIMGLETNNHDSHLVITGITIGTTATFTYTGSGGGTPIRNGQTICLLGINGTGAVSKLNDDFFILTNVTGTTFQLRRASGALVNTSGGTYTSGGTVYVYRVENLDLSGSTVTDCGMCGGTTYPIGISISGPSLNIKCDNLVGYDCQTTLIEWIGVSKSFANDCVVYNPSGSILQATNSTRMYGNKVQGNRTIGTPSAGLAFHFYNQVGLHFANNDIVTYDMIWIDSCVDSVFSDNVLRCVNYHRVLLFKCTYAAFTCRNNLISGNILDNSKTGNNTVPIEFDGANINFNIVENNTFKTATNLLNNLFIAESNGANSNILGRWRNHGAISGHVNPAWTNPGTVNNFSSIEGTDVRVLSFRDAGIIKFVITLVAFNATGGQPNAQIKIKYSVRNDNSPMGGEINVHFASYDQKNATPVFWFTGTATPTISVASLNGSSEYFWDVTLPAHNGAVSAKVECMIDPNFVNCYHVNVA